ncbi:NADH-quinone oxidoreductase subunit N [Fulvivirga sp. 29W222]|uniref:NADH-quinone oxidoreductase subunit N n=1 Tax=Fulvivirga marina TaxID=2494733 RepID=A0A937FWI8_9BACT|nr:NADH-quinone oxidoreductase subunit N [Fulvivirga marina]MBL6445808.1 NADH-quinone oxidoreductase subunit N [Fulvivirga marina]
METTLNDKLRDITSSLSYFQPEFVITIGIILILIAGLLAKSKKGPWVQALCLLILAITIFTDLRQWAILGENPQHLFLSMLGLDKGAVFWKLIFGTGTLLAVFMGFRGSEASNRQGEYHALMLSVVLGAHLLAMANNLLMVFISIELISISSYLLTSFGFNKNSTEAGVKYLLFGAAASGIMLFGMSWLYAFTGSLDFFQPQFAQMLMKVDTVPLAIGCFLVLGGILFKISAAPMHIWTPDVYTSAPTPVVAFFSVVPKLAGFALLVKWVIIINLFGLSPLNWSSILAVIAMLTITIGNFSALWQKNVKRMLAYSSIAHSGFLLVAMVAFSELAMHSLLFYAAVYLIMNIAAFIFVNYLERSYGYTNVDHYRGLIKASIPLSIMIIVIMISLAGLPPTGGFTAKLLIFTSLWESYSTKENSWMLYLMIFGLTNTVVSLFYYLRIPYYMIFKAPQDETPKNKNLFSFENFLGFIMVLALLLTFFKPDGLMRIINSVSFAF